MFLPVHVCRGVSVASCSTWHIHRAVLIHRVSYAQLATVVAPPTLYAAPGHDGARVVLPQIDGNA
jgi:hypothetical protein